MEALTAETLLALGFRELGNWVASANGLGIAHQHDADRSSETRVLLDARNSLYAFATNDDVLYIGKTSRSVRERLLGYRNPHSGQRTNVRCNARIREMTAGGKEIRILVFNPISHLRYGDFDLNLAAALEDSLISSFNPPWNGRQGGRLLTEEAEREEGEQLAALAAEKSAITVPEMRDSASPAPITSFKIRLGSAYFNQGLINPGVDASRYLGEHDEPVAILFDNSKDDLLSRIDRHANQGGAVRIVGNNRAIAIWFQKNFRLGDIVEANVLDRNTIQLNSKANKSNSQS